MVEDYFGLIRAPFKLSADPYFYFDSKTHHKALAYLQYGIQQAEGFVVITGDTGTGKTTLVDHLLSGIDDSQVLAAKIDISHIGRGEVLRNVLSAFRIEAEGTDHVALIEALEDFLNDQFDAGKQVVLVVDEAQNLATETLEELRVLTNISREGLPLLQIFLVGQSEMKAILAKPELEQFRQRVIASYHLSALARDETAAYIDHRLYAAGYDGDQSLFTDRAQDLVHEFTGGVPRKINKLCARILLKSALDKSDFVDAATVQQVIDDLQEEQRDSGTPAPTNVVPFAGADAGKAPPAEEPLDPVSAGDLPDWQEPAVVNGDESFAVESADEEKSVKTAQADRRQAPAPAKQEDMPVISVLDRLGRKKRALEEADVSDPEPKASRVMPSLEEEDDFRELAREINRNTDIPDFDDAPEVTLDRDAEDLQEDDEMMSAPLAGSGKSSSQRVEMLKSDLDVFVNEIRHGLAEIESSMKSVSERIKTVEAYRESRSQLLLKRLEEIDRLLGEVRGGK